MAVTVEPPDGHGPRTPSATGPIDVLDAADICPYLIAADGAWRSGRPSRDHRCGAIAPPPILTPEKQRQLCLGDDHRTCATFRAAHTRSQGPPGAGSRPPRAEPLWPIARTAPVVLESARPRLGALPGVPGRTSYQALLAGLVVLAFVAVVLARTSSPGPAATVEPSPTVAVTQRPTARPTPRPSPSPSASVSAPASPSASTAVAPSPQTYTVRRGDTLLAIAERFGVPIRTLQQVNGITDPSLLRIGQVLTIPAG